MKLVLEHGPRPQAVTEMVFSGGRLSIGRSEDCDWRLDDPEMFVSRRHCIVSEQGGRVMVTDASSGGLFIDNAAHPLGPGNSVPAEPGMKLRIGDFTLRLEADDHGVAAPARQAAAPVAPVPGGFDFGAPDAAPPAAPERPASLPDPFGLRGSPAAPGWSSTPEPQPLDRADPFELDLRGGGAFGDALPDGTLPDDEGPDMSPRARQRARGPLTDENPVGAPVPPGPAAPDLFAGLSASFGPAAPDPRGGAEPPDPVPPDPVPPIPRPDIAAPPGALPAAEPATATGNDALAALYRGLGVSGRGTPEETEQIGRAMRALTEGLMTLLRHRAQERARVRVAQTVIASQNVNPLKFLASTDEGVESLIAPRGRGYLDPDPALAEAFRDLHDHQMRTWAAMQTALRRMAMKFDPAEIAREMEDVGRLESLFAGGRSARLWQLYEERFREIARAAEEQFLGEVGADFRDAYENRKE